MIANGWKLNESYIFMYEDFSSEVMAIWKEKWKMLEKKVQQVTFAVLVYNRVVTKSKNRRIRYNLYSITNFDIFWTRSNEY